MSTPVNHTNMPEQASLEPNLTSLQRRLQALAVSNVTYPNGNNITQSFQRNLSNTGFPQQLSQEQSGEINPNLQNSQNFSDSATNSNPAPIQKVEQFEQPVFNLIKEQNPNPNLTQIEQKIEQTDSVQTPTLEINKSKLPKNEPVIAKNEVKPFERKTEQPVNIIMNFFRKLRPNHNEKDGEYPSLKNMNKSGNLTKIQGDLDNLRSLQQSHH